MKVQPEAKRLLALSGGGVRGIVEVAFLEQMERAYKHQYGEKTRLCDVFDLIGGTSTGALVATALALGHPLDRVRHFYLARASELFSKRRWWAYGRAPFFDSAFLASEIRKDIGDITLSSESFQTHLAIVTKRLDTGSPWIVSTLPHAPHFDDPVDGSYLGNRHYPVVELLRASTAAPTLFLQQALRIAHDVEGVFVDGGLSPYNDPSFALLQLARMRAFGLEWPAGKDCLYIVSIGTGRFRQRIPQRVAARMGPLRTALMSLRGSVIDGEQHSLMTMEWLGTSRRPAWINSDVGHLDRETLGPEPLFTFQRLDFPLEAADLTAAGFDVSARDLRRFRKMDDPAIIAPLYDLAREYVAKFWTIEDVLESDPLVTPYRPDKNS